MLIKSLRNKYANMLSFDIDAPNIFLGILRIRSIKRSCYCLEVENILANECKGKGGIYRIGKDNKATGWQFFEF